MFITILLIYMVIGFLVFILEFKKDDDHGKWIIMPLTLMFIMYLWPLVVITGYFHSRKQTKRVSSSLSRRETGNSDEAKTQVSIRDNDDSITTQLNYGTGMDCPSCGGGLGADGCCIKCGKQW